jgi:hypothetical protein
MEVLNDKKFQLIVMVSIISYLSLRGVKLFQNTSFVFIITFLLAYRVKNEPEKSIIIGAFVAYLLRCMKRYEKFSSTEVFKITFNDDDILTLGEGTFTDKTIPRQIIKKLNDITSFTVDDKYYVLITKKYAQGPQSFRGTYIIQNENPFDQVTKIEIIKN